MALPNDCVAVDLDGLRKQLARKGPAFVAWELLQNALDAEGVTQVNVTVECQAFRPAVDLEVEDDSPVGFQDLSHAWTLFAPSNKKADPGKRGFMNIGEKLALSMCEAAVIATTTGTVAFDRNGRHRLHTKRERGTHVLMTLRMTHAEGKQMLQELRDQVIPPAAVRLTINGDTILPLPIAADYVQELPTRIADSEGYLRATRRKTSVHLYPVVSGDHARLYEMGIPVVEIDCSWHVDVGQKVPLNSDRDNVTPAYLREVYAGVLNHMAQSVKSEEAAEPWVATALESPLVDPDAVRKVVAIQYGEKRVVADPSDPEGTKIAVTRGYTVIPGNAYSKPAWESIRNAQAVLPAGQVTPSPKPFSPDGDPLILLDPDKYLMEHEERIAFIQRFALKLLGRTVFVRIAVQPEWGFAACYRRGELFINQDCPDVGFRWFRKSHWDGDVVSLIIHELAHDRVSDHLSSKFHEECTRLAGLAVKEAIENPGLYAPQRENT